MVFFNYALRKLNAKIVYYGPGLCGKTTNLTWIHENFDGGQRGKMISLATEGDRTIFFDLLPLNIGTIRDMQVSLQLYTVPGQVHYNATRQLVLKGVDGVVFVADSQRAMLGANLESWENLKENLLLQGIELADFPHVLQFNKRDLKDILSIESLDEHLNEYGAPFFESVATVGIGVQETLEGIVKLVMRDLRQRYEPAVAPEPEAALVESAPIEVPAPPPAPPAGQAAVAPFPVPSIAPPSVRPAPAAASTGGGPDPDAVTRPSFDHPPVPEPAVAEPIPAGSGPAGESRGEDTQPVAGVPEAGERPVFAGEREEERWPDHGSAGGPFELAGGPPAEEGAAAEEDGAPASPASEEAVFETSPGSAPDEGAAGEVPRPVPAPVPSHVDELVESVVGAAAVRPPAPAAAAEAPPEVGAAPAGGGDASGRRELLVVGSGDPFEDGEAVFEPSLPAAASAVVQVGAEEGEGAAMAVAAEGNQLHVTLEGTRALARSGDVRELDIMVPVPGAWIGNRRVTLQLRLTLVPASEEET